MCGLGQGRMRPCRPCRMRQGHPFSFNPKHATHIFSERACDVTTPHLGGRGAARHNLCVRARVSSSE